MEMNSSVADWGMVVGPLVIPPIPPPPPPPPPPPRPPIIGSLFSIFIFQVPLKSGCFSCATAERSATDARSAATVRIRVAIRSLQGQSVPALPTCARAAALPGPRPCPLRPRSRNVSLARSRGDRAAAPPLTGERGLFLHAARRGGSARPAGGPGDRPGQ